MNRILITLLLFLCFAFSSFSQENGCCPDFTAEITFAGCDLEICVASTAPKRRCLNAVFNLQIHNQDGFPVFSAVQESFCFTFTGAVPGDTYTVSGFVSQNPTPIECFPPAQILPSTVTVPEDCGCCPELDLTIDLVGCDLLICWDVANPNVDFCLDGITTIQLGIEEFPGSIQGIFEIVGDDCYLWSGGIPGHNYAIGVRVTHSSGCGAGTPETWDLIHIPEGCAEPFNDENQSETRIGKLETGTDIIVYPNPGFDMLNLKGDLQIGYSINVFSITGEFISKEFVSKENQFSKDISTMNPGLYQVTVNAADGTLIQQLKFVKI